METIKNNATSVYKAYEEMTPKRQELYDAAEKLITDYRGYVGGLITYADYNIDDNSIDRYTPERLYYEYIDSEIGEFDTALDVITYLSEECGVWEGEDLQMIAIEQERIGDIYNIGGTWYFGNL